MPDRDDDLPPLPEPGPPPSPSEPPEEPSPPARPSEPSAPASLSAPSLPEAEPPAAATPQSPPPSSSVDWPTPQSPPPSSSVDWPTAPPVAPPSSPPVVGKPPEAPSPAPPGDATPWWARVWLLATFAAGTAVVLLVAAAVMVVAAQDDDDGVARASGEPTTTTEEPGTSAGGSTTDTDQDPTTTAPSTTTTTAPPPPGFGDGLQRVGVDIQPGRYLATDVGFACYWERVSGFGGTLDDVIINGNVQGSQAIVEILPSDAGFTSHDCGRWVVYSPPPTPATTFDDGDWSVGQDVQPGTYRSDAGPFCWWERAVGFTHDIGDQIVDYGMPTEPVTVTIAAGERFTSIGCGRWTPA